MDLGLFLYFRMHLSLSSGLCWWLLYSSNLTAIGGLLKLHMSQRLLIISIINTGGLEISLSAQIDPSILEYFGEEAGIGEYAG